MFKTELHLHSGTVSDCATISDREIIEKYLAADYTTVVLTNHLSPYTYKTKTFDRSDDSWDQKIDFFMEGVKGLTAAAEGRLNILWAIELRSDLNDYLVYGLDEAALRETKDLYEIPLRDAISLIHERGGIIYQAHPFRNHMKIINPDLLDGVEVFNGHIGHDSRNDIAELWAKKYGLLGISGSDVHHAKNDARGGILTEQPITSMPQLLEILREERFELVKGN